MRTFIFLVATVVLSQDGLAQVGQAVGASAACALFNPAEISGYLGEPVEPGEKHSLDSSWDDSCSWYAQEEDSDSFAMLSIWPTKLVDTPSLEKTNKPHPELGEGGYAIKDWNIIGSWTGGVVLGDRFYRVLLNGPLATEANVVAWLKLVAARRDTTR